jgi:hypothetical protein
MHRKSDDAAGLHYLNASLNVACGETRMYNTVVIIRRVKKIEIGLFPGAVAFFRTRKEFIVIETTNMR